MEKYVLLYWMVHGLACFQRPYMAFLAFSTLLFSFFFNYYRRVHCRAPANNVEEDPKKPIVMAAESVHFWCSAAISFLFVLRFSSFAYCIYWILHLVFSIGVTHMENMQHYDLDGTNFLNEILNPTGDSAFFQELAKTQDLMTERTAPFGFALVGLDEVLNSSQQVVAYGFYIVQAWNIRKHNLYENNPWGVRFYWAMVVLLFYTAYQGESWMLISAALLTHIHNFFNQLQTMFHQKDNFFGRGLILSILWSVERFTYGVFKVGVPGFFLVVMIYQSIMMLFFILVLRGVGALEPPSSVYIE